MVTTSAFARDGVQLLHGLVTRDQVAACRAALTRAESSAVGSRNLLQEAWCRALAAELLAQDTVSGIAGRDAVAVQCTSFEKSSDTNWLVPLHQDLSIPVAARVDAPELKGWSDKEGVTYVQAPVDVMQKVVALRLHLDDCGADDGPLRVVPGSHSLGVLAPNEMAAVRADRGELVCVARPGDVLAMRPLVLHASSKSRGTSRRRVLHFLLGPSELPLGLRWGDPVGLRSLARA
jgi:ectoine hydroxylase-related dioxygenase (phytanoyl-CoA dioxygenase family)